MPRDPGLSDPLLINDWLAVARSSSIPPGQLLPVRVLERDLVLWRGENLHAWRDLCIHRGAKLSLGRVFKCKDGDCLACPYHGWEYNILGECVRIPANPDQPPPLRARVETFAVRERYGLIWVCLGTARGSQLEVPAFPEGEAEGFRLVQTGPYEFHAQGPRIIENLLDVAHLAIAHAGMLGDPAHAEIGEYSVTTTPQGIVAKDIPVWQLNRDGTGQPGKALYTYWVERPLTARMVKIQGDERFAILRTVTPVDEQTSLAWVVLALNYAHDVPEEELRRFQDTVTAQDIRIVNSQRPELLPLDLQTELHLRSDQLTIAYRRWLQQMSLRYGTS